MPTDLSMKLTEVVERAGYGPRRRSELRRELAQHHGVQVALQTILYWLSGDRTPELVHLRVLLDACGVHGAERDHIVDLALPVGLRSSNRLEDDVPTEPGAA